MDLHQWVSKLTGSAEEVLAQLEAVVANSQQDLCIPGGAAPGDGHQHVDDAAQSASVAAALAELDCHQGTVIVYNPRGTAMLQALLDAGRAPEGVVGLGSSAAVFVDMVLQAARSEDVRLRGVRVHLGRLPEVCAFLRARDPLQGGLTGVVAQACSSWAACREEVLSVLFNTCLHCQAMLALGLAAPQPGAGALAEDVGAEVLAAGREAGYTLTLEKVAGPGSNASRAGLLLVRAKGWEPPAEPHFAVDAPPAQLLAAEVRRRLVRMAAPPPGTITLRQLLGSSQARGQGEAAGAEAGAAAAEPEAKQRQAPTEQERETPSSPASALAAGAGCGSGAITADVLSEALHSAAALVAGGGEVALPPGSRPELSPSQAELVHQLAHQPPAGEGLSPVGAKRRPDSPPGEGAGEPGKRTRQEGAEASAEAPAAAADGREAAAQQEPAAVGSQGQPASKKLPALVVQPPPASSPWTVMAQPPAAPLSAAPQEPAPAASPSKSAASIGLEQPGPGSEAAAASAPSAEEGVGPARGEGEAGKGAVAAAPALAVEATEASLEATEPAADGVPQGEGMDQGEGEGARPAGVEEGEVLAALPLPVVEDKAPPPRHASQAGKAAAPPAPQNTAPPGTAQATAGPGTAAQTKPTAELSKRAKKRLRQQERQQQQQQQQQQQVGGGQSGERHTPQNKGPPAAHAAAAGAKGGTPALPRPKSSAGTGADAKAYQPTAKKGVQPSFKQLVTGQKRPAQGGGPSPHPGMGRQGGRPDREADLQRWRHEQAAREEQEARARQGAAARRQQGEARRQQELQRQTHLGQGGRAAGAVHVGGGSAQWAGGMGAAQQQQVGALGLPPGTVLVQGTAPQQQQQVSGLVSLQGTVQQPQFGMSRAGLLVTSQRDSRSGMQHMQPPQPSLQAPGIGQLLQPQPAQGQQGVLLSMPPGFAGGAAALQGGGMGLAAPQPQQYQPQPVLVQQYQPQQGFGGGLVGADQLGTLPGAQPRQQQQQQQQQQGGFTMQGLLQAGTMQPAQPVYQQAQAQVYMAPAGGLLPSGQAGGAMLVQQGMGQPVLMMPGGLPGQQPGMGQPQMQPPGFPQQPQQQQPGGGMFRRY